MKFLITVIDDGEGRQELATIPLNTGITIIVAGKEIEITIREK